MRCTKALYSSWAKAHSVAQRRVRRGDIVALAIYHCRSCGGWHLTSETDGKKRMNVIQGAA